MKVELKKITKTLGGITVVSLLECALHEICCLSYIPLVAIQSRSLVLYLVVLLSDNSG